MAMALDRSFEAIAERTDPARRHLDETRKRGQTIMLGRGDRGRASSSRKPSARPPPTRTRPAIRSRTVTIEEWLLAKIQVVLDYVQDPTTWVFAVTERVGIFILQQLLLPLQEFLVEAPWFTTVVGLTAIAFVVSGLRPALTTLAMLA